MRAILNKNLLAMFLILVATSINASGAVLFEEPFEDANFSSRGWYDSTGGVLSDVEYTPGSTKSFECKFLLSETVCTGGTPARHLFTETESVHISYYVKYSSNWEGSNRNYHPHEFLLLTNIDSNYWGPSESHLTVYIEQNEGTPLLQIQDVLNIDQTRVGENLTTVTENRAVAGCNGDSDGYGDGDCYSYGSYSRNVKMWRASSVYFQDTPGAYYKNDWHHVEAYFKLNSISNGIGIADGVIRYWYDGQLVMDHNNVMMRTGQYPNMMFNQFQMLPWIGDGSPVEQTMWVDNLVVSTSRTIDEEPPSPPTNLRAD